MSVEPVPRPFAQTPELGNFVRLPYLDTALTELTDAARAGDGLVILSGAWGTGKSHLALVLAEQLATLECEPITAAEAKPAKVANFCRRDTDRALTPIIVQGSGLITRRSFHLAILHALQKPYTGLREQEARLSILDTARELVAAERPLVVIVDDVQEVSDRILEELRAITNFVHDGQPLVRVVMIADLDFDERLATSALEAVNHRIICQANLRTLTTPESVEYIRERLTHLGLDPAKLLELEAIEEIACIAAGLPRAINVLAERSLAVAANRSSNAIEPNTTTDGEPASNPEAASALVTRQDVIDALAAVESLSLPWRRPLSLENESWRVPKPINPIPQLEPLDGAVFEVGTSSTANSAPDESSATAPQPPSTRPASPQPADGLAPLRRIKEFIDDTGELGFALDTYLNSVAESDDSDQQSSDPADVIKAENPLKATPPQDHLDKTVEQSGSAPDGSAVEESAAEESAAAECLSEHVPDFAQPFPAPEPEQIPVEPIAASNQSAQAPPDETSSKDDSPETEAKEQASTEQASNDEAVPQPTAEIESQPEPLSLDDTQAVDPEPGDVRSAERAIERSESASKLLDAMIPLVETERPEDSAVEALEQLLETDAAGLNSRDDIIRDGDESTLGGQALNLAAEIGSALQPRDQHILEGDDRDTPTFAFDQTSRTRSTAPASQNAVNAAPPHHAAAFEPETATPSAGKRRLEGLFTRLRRQSQQ